MTVWQALSFFLPALSSHVMFVSSFPDEGVTFGIHQKRGCIILSCDD